MPRGLALAATVRSLSGPIALRSDASSVTELRASRGLPGCNPPDTGMFPVDVDAVELRIRLQEVGAGLREGLPALFRGGHLVERR